VTRRIVAWGSYDESKPRVRLLLRALRDCDALAAEIHVPVWASIRDKATAGRATIAKALVRLLAAYPGALISLWRQPRGGAVLLGYPAILDIFAARPVARLRGHKVVFDAFIPLHDTLVRDRAMVPADGLTARLAWKLERRALTLADIILVDTDQHGDFLAREFDLPRDRFVTVLVGAEPAFWQARNVPAQSIARGRPTVLFYGQLIPLHGLDTILDAIGRTQDEPIDWLLVGSGQEEPKLRKFLGEYRGGNIEWRPWVPYDELPALIAAADVCLGIFGTSDKAARVIPNKVFQALAAGKPLITRASPATEELADRFPGAVMTVPAGDGAALAAAVRKAADGSVKWQQVPFASSGQLDSDQGAAQLLARLDMPGT
jgi:glycosyltransferase involved in cell wall biosynthesis